MHHKAWYAGTCGMNGHELIIWTTYYGQMCVLCEGCGSIGLWIHWFRDLDATIPNGLVTTGRTSLVGVGHSGSNPIVLLMLRTVFM
jgi:hypothetical protein